MSDLKTTETPADDVRLDADILAAARANAEKGRVDLSDYLYCAAGGASPAARRVGREQWTFGSRGGLKR